MAPTEGELSERHGGARGRGHLLASIHRLDSIAVADVDGDAPGTDIDDDAAVPGWPGAVQCARMRALAFGWSEAQSARNQLTKVGSVADPLSLRASWSVLLRRTGR